MKKSLLNRQIDTYINEVKKRLTCSAKTKTRFITHLAGSAEEFMNESPGCTMGDIIEFLGQPETLARDFMETLDEVEISRGKRNRLLRNFALVVLILVIGALLIIAVSQLFAASGGTMLTAINTAPSLI